MEPAQPPRRVGLPVRPATSLATRGPRTSASAARGVGTSAAAAAAAAAARGSPDPDRSRLFFANEPNPGRKANCLLRELVLEEDELDGPPPNRTGGPFVAFVLLTTA